MTECPECRATLKPSAKSCRCGWKKGDEAGEKPFIYENCEYCKESYRWIRKSESMPRVLNRLVGRSLNGGWICRDCYEARAETDYRDSALTARMVDKANEEAA